jgi:hypothetical protein
MGTMDTYRVTVTAVFTVEGEELSIGVAGQQVEEMIRTLPSPLLVTALSVHRQDACDPEPAREGQQA